MIQRAGLKRLGSGSVPVLQACICWCSGPTLLGGATPDWDIDFPSRPAKLANSTPLPSVSFGPRASEKLHELGQESRPGAKRSRPRVSLEVWGRMEKAA
jgi:hypothetical protein